MRRRKITTKLFVIAFYFIAQQSFAQKMYVNVHAGYNFNSAPLTSINSTSNGSSSTTYDRVDISLGKGVNLDAAFGYMFNKHFGTELAVSYLIGGTTTLTNNTTSSKSTTNFSSSMLRFMPSIIMSTEFGKIYPYAKFGLILGSGAYTITEDEKSTSSGSTNFTSTKYDGGFAFGYFSGFGVSYKINDKISLLSEISIVSLSYAPSKGEVTESKSNGVDMLPNMTIRDKQTEYSDNYTVDNNSSSNTSVARKSIKQSLPFSSIGFSLGVRYTLR
jgi:hypothetical protein